MESLGQRFGFDAKNSPRSPRDAVLKDLWWRDRQLRNHNMYMGPSSAFKDLVPPSLPSQQQCACNYEVSKPKYTSRRDSFC